MANYKLSIIVAMYNIESYIQYCLESCAAQFGVKDRDFEVIIVNDGSTDRSLDVAESYAQSRENFRIVNQNNAGLSAARNAGLDQACGDYVWFVDGDDAIASNAVSTIIKSIRSSGSDAFLFNYCILKDNQIIKTSNFDHYPVLSGKQIHDRYLRILPMMAWLTVYRRDALICRGLKFLPGIIHEDFEFSVRAHHSMNSISFLSEPLYYYRIDRSESIMSENKKDNTRSLISELTIIDSFSDFFKKENTPFVRVLLGMCATAFINWRFDSAFVKNENTIRLWESNKHRLYKLMWNSGQWKRRLLVFAIAIMPPSVISSIIQLRRKSNFM